MWLFNLPPKPKVYVYVVWIEVHFYIPGIASKSPAEARENISDCFFSDSNDAFWTRLCCTYISSHYLRDWEDRIENSRPACAT